MPSAETILDEAVPTGKIALVPAPGLRHGDIESGTGVVTVGGFPQPSVTFAVDYSGESIEVRNDGATPWAAGAKLVVTWTGLSLEATVEDHEARITALESGGAPPQTGEGGGGGSDVGLTERVDALESQVATHEWQINGHEARISAGHTALVNLDARVVLVEEDVALLKDEATSHNETLTDHETRIDTLEAAAPPTGGAMPVQFSFYFVGQPASQAVYTIVAAIPVVIPANLAGTVVYDRTQATANATFVLSKMDHLTGLPTTLGNIAITRDSHFSCNLVGAGGALVAGDVLQVTAPIQDASLADIGITVMGTTS